MSVAEIRNKVASAIWLVAVIAALILAIRALMVALKFEDTNAIVKFFEHMAARIDLGTFKSFKGHNAAVKEALVNWGLAAVIYLIVGKAFDRVIRP